MPWDRVHRIEVTGMRRTSGVLKVDDGPPPSHAVRTLDAAMLGTIGVLRYTQPLRIIATAAELGLLPPDLPVLVYGRPLLPSTRGAFRRLEHHHDRVEIVRATAPR